jgi:hypothetical protein
MEDIMPNKRLCDYCQQETLYVSLDIMSKTRQLGFNHNQAKIDIYFCAACNVEYVPAFMGNGCRRNLYTIINEETYRWTIDCMSGHGYMWYVAEPGIPGQKVNSGLKLLKVFDIDVPTITPENIYNKLSMYLLFL